MIEHAHIDERQRAFEFGSDVAIGLTGFGHTGRMVMREDHGRGVVRETTSHDFARMYAGAVDGATEQFLERNHAMALVEEQAGEYLVRMRADARAQEIGGG